VRVWIFTLAQLFLNINGRPKFRQCPNWLIWWTIWQKSTRTGPNAKVFTCPGSFRASKADCQERDNEAHRQKHRRGLGPIFQADFEGGVRSHRSISRLGVTIQAGLLIVTILVKIGSERPRIVAQYIDGNVVVVDLIEVGFG